MHDLLCRVLTGAFDKVVKVWSQDGQVMHKFDGFRYHYYLFSKWNFPPAFISTFKTTGASLNYGTRTRDLLVEREIQNSTSLMNS